jgi:lipoate-protein ligase A
MGISGKPERLLNLDHPAFAQIPTIKRFSGGGTVLVDSNTLFISFLGSPQLLGRPLFPKHIMEWSVQHYQTALPSIALRENDYVIEDRKFGGNAQYIRKDRWLHHSRLHWDYNPQLMSCLKLPEKRPDYRANRSHQDFLCKLSDYAPTQNIFLENFLEGLGEKYAIEDVSPEQALAYGKKKHRQATVIVELKKRSLPKGA